jgi:aryl-alcohol dehydrogenase-like predicted oxidoreductase
MFVPFFPLGSAFTGGPRQLAADPAITEVAARRQATPSQIALAWLLHRSERILLIPGTGSIPHLEENVAAGDIELERAGHATARGRRPGRRPDGGRRALGHGVASVASAARVAASAGA